LSYFNKMLFKSIKSMVIISIFLFLLSSSVQAYEIDTTMVREKPEKKTSTTDVILAVPQFIIDLPFKTLQVISSFTVNQIYFSSFVEYLMSFRGDRIDGIMPVIGFGDKLGFKGGLVWTSKDFFTKGKRFQVKATYSTHDYQTYSIRYRTPGKYQTFRGLTIETSYKQKPWESFYGTGNNSDGHEVAFNHEQTFFGINWHHILHTTTRLNISSSYRIINIYDGEDPAHEGSLPAIREMFDLSADEIQSARILTFEAGIIHDWRNNRGQTTSGGYESISLSYNKGLGRSKDLEYFYGKADIRHYLHLFKKRTLMFRILVEGINRLNDSPQLPFYLLTSLGGEANLHAYERWRFLDYSMTLAAVEYRYPLLSSLDAFVFFEEGRVFEEITEEFSFKDWKYSTGFGLRAWSIGGVIFSAQIAWGAEDPEIYIQMGDTF
jgi:outer membrane protein assembly factor BamA